MVRTQVQLTGKQVERLKRMAPVKKVSVAELIRRSVDKYLERAGDFDPRERFERAKSVVGQFRSEQGDLSVRHDEYLEEVFGER